MWRGSRRHANRDHRPMIVAEPFGHGSLTATRWLTQAPRGHASRVNRRSG